ncbi:hypothetical protein DBT_0594 [Dissulfuribacter thermophilus]|uniref:Uncharacterized protein n=1 Tax=Dissulfuribacter thermophilus TaxID=1156395 RepID=A0A1B9F890_9BACT|nr:hypothetical protein DBT_0594 [Dissulfuribacter thermophilus]
MYKCSISLFRTKKLSSKRPLPQYKMTGFIRLTYRKKRAFFLRQEIGGCLEQKDLA